MEVRVCRRCKKMFQYVAGPTVCPRCRQVEEEMFQKVKDYLRENKGASMREVSEETEVPVSLIESFLRQGRLEVSPDSPIALTCEICGAQISTGRYCAHCKGQLMSGLQDASSDLHRKNEQQEEQPKERMRYLKSDRIK